MTPRERVLASVLALTGITAGSVEYANWVEHEGYSEAAYVPVKGDRPTIGHGSTFWENGQPVRMGQRITPARAEALALYGLNKDQKAVAATIPAVPLTKGELRIYGDFTGQYGITAWNDSSVKRELLAGNYEAACKALLAYRMMQVEPKPAPKFDCSTPGNKVCRGVWTRQLKRYSACMEEQNG